MNIREKCGLIYRFLSKPKSVDIKNNPMFYDFLINNSISFELSNKQQGNLKIPK